MIHNDPKKCWLGSIKRVYGEYRDGNLTLEQFIKLSQEPCFYCGLKAKDSNSYNYFQSKRNYGRYASDFAIKHGTAKYNGLDRVDNNLPHNIDNVVPCCKTCNWSKSNMSIKEFRKWIRRLINYQQKK